MQDVKPWQDPTVVRMTLSRMQEVADAAVGRGSGTGPARKIAYVYVTRLAESLQAIDLLAAARLPREIMTLCRPISEAAIRVRWMNTEAERAALLVDESTLQSSRLLEAWARQGVRDDEQLADLRAAVADVKLRRGSDDVANIGLPKTLEQMEKQIWPNPIVYDLLFRWACQDAHGALSSALKTVRSDPEEEFRAAVHHSAMAAKMLLEAALPILGHHDLRAELRRGAEWLKHDWD